MSKKDSNRETLCDLVADQLSVGHRVPEDRHARVMKTLLSGNTNHCTLHAIEGFRLADQIVIVCGADAPAIRAVHVIDRRSGCTVTLRRLRS